MDEEIQELMEIAWDDYLERTEEARSIREEYLELEREEQEYYSAPEFFPLQHREEEPLRPEDIPF